MRKWKVLEKPNTNDSGNSFLKNAVYQSEEGKYRINIVKAFNVSLTTNQ